MNGKVTRLNSGCHVWSMAAADDLRRNNLHSKWPNLWRLVDSKRGHFGLTADTPIPTTKAGRMGQSMLRGPWKITVSCRPRQYVDRARAHDCTD